MTTSVALLAGLIGLLGLVSFQSLNEVIRRLPLERRSRQLRRSSDTPATLPANLAALEVLMRDALRGERAALDRVAERLGRPINSPNELLAALAAARSELGEGGAQA